MVRPQSKALAASLAANSLRRLPNWPDWQAAEFKQLDSMEKQNMYCTPTFPPPDAIILRQHWNYAIKSDGTRKARICCDGSPRAAPQLKLALTPPVSSNRACVCSLLVVCMKVLSV
jgi:hypothetical protein